MADSLQSLRKHQQTWAPLSAVARLLGVDRSTAERWARRGYIPARRFGPRGRWLVELQAAQALVKQQRAG